MTTNITQMNTTSNLRWIFCLVLCFSALPTPAQDRIVGRQEFINILGGSISPEKDEADEADEFEEPIVVESIRGVGGVKAIRPTTPEFKAIPSAPAVSAPKEIAMSINFKYNSTEIADEFSRNQLREAGAAFSSSALSGLVFEIGGHTDGMGSEAYNLNLSQRRAQAVKNLLCNGYRVNCNNLLAMGYGKSIPIASNDDETGRAQNRRVVIKRIK